MSETKKPTGFHDKLVAIQSTLKAPKNQFNSFGNYKYRNAEDILEAVKPLLKEHGLRMKLSDALVSVGERYYIKSTVTLTDGVVEETTDGWAREEENKKGMDGSQITGASSSYARKYALNGMFLIDDTKDSDATNDGSSSYKKPSAPVTKRQTAATAANTASSAPSAETTKQDKPKEGGSTQGKKHVDINSPAFKGMVAWVAAYAAGTVDEAIDSLSIKYDINAEARDALKTQALISRKPDLPK